jgi:hypothetical protein
MADLGDPSTFVRLVLAIGSGPIHGKPIPQADAQLFGPLNPLNARRQFRTEQTTVGGFERPPRCGSHLQMKECRQSNQHRAALSTGGS